MNPDEQTKIYNKGVQEGLKHTLPSQETDRRLRDIESTIKNIPVRLAHIDDKQDENGRILESILTETKKTNGRVTNLEKWRYASMAILTVAIMASGVIMTLVIQNLDYRISSAIDTALNGYELEIIQ